MICFTSPKGLIISHPGKRGSPSKPSRETTSEQLAKVMGVATKSEVTNQVMFDIINSYQKAMLTTNIDEDVSKIY